MPEIHPELTWVPLYESVFDDLFPILPSLPESWKNSVPAARFFDKMKGSAHAKHRSNLADSRRRLFQRGDLVTGVRRLPGTTTSSKSQVTGLARTKATWLVGKKPCIPVTREELVALSLMMGMPITKSNDGYYSGIGAHGLSIDLSHTEATWKLSLAKGSRIPRHAPSMGSGYTSLMAKHLACGSIPFGESVDWIRSVYVTDEVLTAVKDGLCIKDTQAYGGPSLEFLRRLPANKAVDAYYGFLTKNQGHEIGSILDDKSNSVGKWARLVAGIAFGGLVPQADGNVVEAVKFTVAGSVDGCVQNLEYLVDALHMASDDKKIFGDRVAERTAAKGHIYVNYDYPASDKNPRDAASTFSRYTNLLEYVLAQLVEPLVPNTAILSETSARSGSDLENGLQPPLIVNNETQTANDIAMKNLVPGQPSDRQPSDRVFDKTVELLSATYQAAVKDRHQEALTAEEHELAKEHLGETVKAIMVSFDKGNNLSLGDASMEGKVRS